MSGSAAQEIKIDATAEETGQVTSTDDKDYALRLRTDIQDAGRDGASERAEARGCRTTVD